MSLTNLDNLVKTGQLKIESMNQLEVTGLLNSGKARLHDAANETLNIESRFDLAYNAAHSLSLAALRWHGYRSGNRYLVFQVLPHTVGVGAEVWRILAKCHDRRNLAEYEGYLEIDNQLLNDLLNATQILLKQILTLTA
ncbi:MAG: hypothetical protein A3E88_06460 [Legionellales bacterium RIFCSPHIGHO2_12_FULL_35_11]|nr:MAG: hypothetical protein A3E88_06460 [Legionellales bacterium RIFCSPHIGHO2_12_FULL_35_11]